MVIFQIGIQGPKPGTRDRTRTKKNFETGSPWIPAFKLAYFQKLINIRVILNYCILFYFKYWQRFSFEKVIYSSVILHSNFDVAFGLLSRYFHCCRTRRSIQLMNSYILIYSVSWYSTAHFVAFCCSRKSFFFSKVLFSSFSFCCCFLSFIKLCSRNS